MSNRLNIAVEGCCHGELDKIYASISDAAINGVKVDLLLICGDFQCVRDYIDLQSVAVPPKYRKLNTFHDYVSGDKVAPVMTIFIGGNHESSNILHNLYYGGFVAPNIYFLGFGGVVWYGGVCIGGLSGIYNPQHYRVGHYERIPYSADTMRSIYHVRELEVYRMLHCTRHIDIFLSHDWPCQIWEYGNTDELLRVKPFFRDDIASLKLGSPPLMQVLRELKPSFWFAAHLHVKFAALVPHTTMSQHQEQNSGDAKCESCVAPAAGLTTRFLALDKVLPGRHFLQFFSIPVEDSSVKELHYDVEYLAIIKKTHALLSTSQSRVELPLDKLDVTLQDLKEVQLQLQVVNGGSQIWQPVSSDAYTSHLGNPQTDHLLNILQLPHIWTQPFGAVKDDCHSVQEGSSFSNNSSSSKINEQDANEIDLNDLL